ncbi:hypothetical protein QM467_12460 [Rhodoblastus sp. 17X3]|uniref:hypothetical protein n=1 Tax=Rhodoblastus sp. 17X3 TaxID=3047026 RepID=UPI0024B8489F|nr:hypothetical protein [Rhodoblastus sp. 17X3]MDI9848871.1 hypothetical protein [Rhodoblastus sp. 17X3]
MSHSYFAQAEFAPPLEANAISQRLMQMLQSIGGARTRLLLASDEALIFLALGQMGLSVCKFGVAIQPVAGVAIAELLKIPKETVRRKVARLVQLDLVTATPRGHVIKNFDEWRQLAEAVIS